MTFDERLAYRSKQRVGKPSWENMTAEEAGKATKLLREAGRLLRRAQRKRATVEDEEAFVTAFKEALDYHYELADRYGSLEMKEKLRQSRAHPPGA